VASKGLDSLADADNIDRPMQVLAALADAG